MRIYLQLNANRIELAAFPETKCKELKVTYYAELFTAIDIQFTSCCHCIEIACGQGYIDVDDSLMVTL